MYPFPGSTRRRIALRTLQAFASILTLLLTLVPSVAQPAPFDDESPASRKETSIFSTGTARVTRTPDFVDVTIGVAADEKTALAAQTSAVKIMEATTAAIRAMNLDGMELQTGSVQLSPRYDRRPSDESESRLIGYTAAITLRVRTKDLHSPANVIDAALAAGCNRVESVEFGLTAAIEAREEAVKLATKAAKRKALVMADALDLKIKRVVNASTSSGYWGGWYGGNRYANQAISQMASSGDSSGGPEDKSPLVPGKIEIWAEASVTFGAEGAPAK